MFQVACRPIEGVIDTEIGALRRAVISVDKVKKALELQISRSITGPTHYVSLFEPLISYRKFPVFVVHRVGDIQDATSINWKHVESRENPSDLISRGTEVEELIKSQI